MKAHLLFRVADLDLDGDLPVETDDLVQDLGLESLFDAMAAGDEFLRKVAAAVMLRGLVDPTEIRFRQEALRDCLDQRESVQHIYDLAIEALSLERSVWNFGLRTPDALLRRSRQVLELLVGVLQRLRRLTDQVADQFRSPAFLNLFRTLQQELSDDYFATVAEHLDALRFPRGVLLSARLGTDLRGVSYVVRSEGQERRRWWRRLSIGADQMTVVVPPRDEGGLRALGAVRAHGINVISDVIAQAADHVLSFFQLLRCETGYYLACMNLRDRLIERHEPVCFPDPLHGTEFILHARDLYDPGLTLRSEEPVVGNDVDGAQLRLLAITGANHGGKSTFLRAIGISQLMMQAGMFVPARSFSASVRAGLFTHFKRGEDTAMTSGKFDEELRRMSLIVDRLAPSSLVLMNESFSATNESEAAEIGSAIVRALLDSQVAVGCVTHSYELAERFAGEPGVLFLRAQRAEDGGRTFRLLPGGALPTSFAQDVYQRVFGVPPRDEVFWPGHGGGAHR